MKKYILSLLVLFATMSINAQVIKVYKNNETEPVKTYINTATDKYKVVFEEASSSTPDANLLTGVFTVKAADGTNPAKKVKFTKGNLQATYNGTDYTWGFATNQWDIVGGSADGTGTLTGNNKIDSQENGDVVDLFGWSSTGTSNNWGIHTKLATSNAYTGGKFKDWGGQFPSNNYYTLSKDEWTCLLNTTNVTSGARTFTNRFAKATVHSVKGLLIFPDNYSGTTTGIATENMNNTSTSTYSTISDETWTTMESAGVVFLPAAGYRGGSNVDLQENGSCGFYWSSTSYISGYPYFVHLHSTGLTTVGYNLVYIGISVRLVSEVSE